MTKHIYLKEFPEKRNFYHENQIIYIGDNEDNLVVEKFCECYFGCYFKFGLMSSYEDKTKHDNTKEHIEHMKKHFSLEEINIINYYINEFKIDFIYILPIYIYINDFPIYLKDYFKYEKDWDLDNSVSGDIPYILIKNFISKLYHFQDIHLNIKNLNNLKIYTKWAGKPPNGIIVKKLFENL